MDPIKAVKEFNIARKGWKGRIILLKIGYFPIFTFQTPNGERKPH